VSLSREIDIHLCTIMLVYGVCRTHSKCISYIIYVFMRVFDAYNVNFNKVRVSLTFVTTPLFLSQS